MNVKIKERIEGDPDYLVCSNDFSKKKLNWKPKYTIEDIISTSYIWYKDYLPEYLENSPTAEKLDEVLNCSAVDDIENAQGELEGLELPKGFGRDC